MRSLTALCGLFLGLGLSASSQAAFLQVKLVGQANGSDWTVYVFADPETGPFTNTFSFASSDNAYVVDSTTLMTSQTFASLADARASLTSLWTCVTDAGLPTARSYTTTLNTTGLASLQPVMINAPVAFATVSTMTPSIQMSLPSTFGSYSLALQHNSAGTFILDTPAGYAVPSSTTTWTNASALTPGTDYILSVSAQGSIAGFGFSALTDGTTTLTGMDLNAVADLSSSVPFSTVPEPAALLLAPLGLLVLHRRR